MLAGIGVGVGIGENFLDLAKTLQHIPEDWPSPLGVMLALEDLLAITKLSRQIIRLRSDN